MGLHAVTWRRAAAGALALAVLAACGGGGGEEPTADRPAPAGGPVAAAANAPTKDAFAQEANAICATAGEREDAIFEELFGRGEQPSPEVVQERLGEVVEINRGMVDELRGLAAPAGDEAAVEAILAAFEDGQAFARERLATPEGAMSLLEGDDPFMPAYDLADAYGLAECGTGQAQAPAEGAAIVQLTAREYAFDDLPETVAAGLTALVMINGGQEEHEMILLRMKDGATIEQALEADQADGDPQEFVEDVGFAYAEPGDEGIVNAELTPGQYTMICFIPAPDEQPHFAKGMVRTFTVV